MVYTFLHGCLWGLRTSIGQCYDIPASWGGMTRVMPNTRRNRRRLTTEFDAGVKVKPPNKGHASWDQPFCPL